MVSNEKKKKTTIDDGLGREMVSDMEIRPGGMLVQMRDDSDSNVSTPTIKLRVKYASSYHQIHIRSHASFGDLKKLLAEATGLHPEEQKVIFKNKERDSRAYLDVARVKDGSKIVVVEDTLSKERRCLERLKNASLQKSSKLLQQVKMEVNNLSQQVASLQAKASKEGRVAEKEVENLTEMLMRKLIQLDEIDVVGDLRLQRREQVREVQRKIETLDMIKLHYTILCGNGEEEIPWKQQAGNSHGVTSITEGNQKINKKKGLRMVKEQPRPSESVLVTTKWETFD